MGLSSTSLPGAAAMLSQGFMISRILVDWASVEQATGVYNFTGIDAAFSTLGGSQLLPYCVLGNANPLYDGGMSPTSATGVAAFTNFALAVLQQYAGLGILWELFAQPNVNATRGVGGSVLSGWAPASNATAYAVAMLAAASAIAAAFPAETLVGPTLARLSSGQDTAFAQVVFASGALDDLDVLSMNLTGAPGAPEGAFTEITAFTALAQHYSRGGVALPLVIGSWGYSSADVSAPTQAVYLARMMLYNLGMGINVTVWESWTDASSGVADGVVLPTYINASYPFAPKPAFLAAATLASVTTSCSFVGMVNVSAANASSVECFVVSFTCSTPASPALMATWCVVPPGEMVNVDVPIASALALPAAQQPLGAGVCFNVVDYVNSSLPQVCTSDSTIPMIVGDAPMYAFGPVA